jgi:cytidylate kinase
VSQHFGKDIDDPSLYDLVLNTDGWGRDQVAGLVLDALRARLTAERR